MSRSDLLTKQFYDWEQLGSGRLLAPFPVELEPPFRPFYGHFLNTPFIDDGAQPSLWGRLVSLFTGDEKPEVIEEPSPPIEPYPFDNESALVGYILTFPKAHKAGRESMEQLLVMLGMVNSPLSFEIIATAEQIHLQLVFREPYDDFITSQLHAYFPECILTNCANTLYTFIADDTPVYTVDYGLSQEFMRPIATSSAGDLDPLTSLYGILDQLAPGERVILQVLFSGVHNAWAESMIRSVSFGGKESFFSDAPEMPGEAKEKTAQPLYAVNVRLVAQSSTMQAAARLLNQLSVSLVTASASNNNALIPLPTPDYDVDTRLDDVELRETHRLGMLLNVRELMTFVHFPGASISTKKLLRQTKHTKEAPPSTRGHGHIIGTNIHNGVSVPVSLSTEQRLRHVHIIGATGTGKSSLLLHLINQDIQGGEGVAVLDPHGDLIDAIVPLIPEQRVKDVVLVDLFDSEYPIGLNLLSAHSDIEKQVLSSDLVALFRRFSTSWGDQMNSVFANAILAFLESTRGGTLPDLRKFIIEKEYREQFLKTVTDPDIVYYWQKEFPLLKGGSIAPILTRLDTFLRPKLIRNMVSQAKGLNFQEVMDTKKILLVKVSEGLIGAENSFLLGAFIVAKLQQAALARQLQARGDRTPFYTYIDEFHHFITPSLADMITGVRKYALGLTLAHQNILQVSKHDAELANSLLADAGTRICLRVGDTDAKRLADGLASFNADDVQSLSIGEAIVRVNEATSDFNMKTASLFPPNEQGFKEQIIDHSRATYSNKGETPPDPVTEAEPPPVSFTPPPPKQAPDVPPPRPEPVPEAATSSTKTRHEESQHRYYQTLIKKMAQAQGYKATVEALTPDGAGKVDVLLERDSISIAVEVSVSTEAQWELHNIQKCLNAGYTTVYAAVVDPGTRKALTALVQQLQPVPSNVRVDTPESLLLYIQSQMKPDTKEERIKGYRVKVEHGNLSADEAESKRAIIERVLRGGKGKK